MPLDIAEDEVIRQYLENEMVKQGLTEGRLDDIRGGTHDQMLKDVNYILSTKGDINQPLDQGGTLLHIAIANGYNDIVQHLLDNKASFNSRDEDGWEPVHVAAYWSNENALNMLLKEGADINALTDYGETPLSLCDDTDIKEYITMKLSDLSLKYGSLKSYTLPEVQRPLKMNISGKDSEEELTTRFDDYEDSVSDTLIFNLSTITHSQKSMKLAEDYNNNDNEDNSDDNDEADKDPSNCTYS
ncbi:hypothetical protein SK128_013227 [Halocaridina rubra]|uniref:Uncharacterized protein n=1 Tax=Halocaridina rubra TaxID=373956 RepID=A0AAN8WJP3_HALRR